MIFSIEVERVVGCDLGLQLWNGKIPEKGITNTTNSEFMNITKTQEEGNFIRSADLILKTANKTIVFPLTTPALEVKQRVLRNLNGLDMSSSQTITLRRTGTLFEGFGFEITVFGKKATFYNLITSAKLDRV